MGVARRAAKMAMLGGIGAAAPLSWLGRGRPGVAVACALAFGCAALLPRLFSRGGLVLGPSLELLWLAPFFAAWGLGEGWALFARVPLWDSLTHALGGAMAFSLAAAWARPRLRAGTAALALLGLGAALAAGAVWEIGEFASDQLLRTATQNGNADTMSDLCFDLVGGVAAGLLALVLGRRRCARAPKRPPARRPSIPVLLHGARGRV